MKKPTSSSLAVRLSYKKCNSSRLDSERLFCYVKVINFLLATYATGGIIARAVKYFKNYEQAPSVGPTELPKKRYTGSH